MANNHVTRGAGLLEGFLSRQRAKKANMLISDEKRTGKLLDIGCGSFPYFLTNTEFNEKFGIDPSLKDIDVKGIKLAKSDVSFTPLAFKNNFFDVVTMLAVFEHIEKDSLSAVLHEISRILKKDGVLIITTPSPWSDKLLHLMSKFGLISEVEIHEHKSHYTKSRIVEIINKAGFEKDFIKSGYFELGMNMWFSITK